MLTEENKKSSAGLQVARRRAPRLTKEARAEQIRRAALHVLAENGIGHSNHSMIAAAAEISLPAVFAYYPTHQALTDAVLEDISSYVQDDIVRHVTGLVDDPLEALDQMLLRFAKTIETHRDHARVWLDWSTSVRSEVWPKYLVFHGEVCALVQVVIERGQAAGRLRADVDAKEASQVIVGIAHLVAQLKFAETAQARIERTVRTLFNNYLAIPAPRG